MTETFVYGTSIRDRTVGELAAADARSGERSSWASQYAQLHSE
jgi:hypothetical protein